MSILMIALTVASLFNSSSSGNPANISEFTIKDINLEVEEGEFLDPRLN